MPALLRNTSIAFAAVLTLAVGGCTSNAPPPAASTSSALTEAKPAAVVITDAARAEAKEIFGSRCNVCHGATGGGDGPASAGLTPHPRNFHDAVWQKSVPDEHIEKIIVYGGAAVGKAPMMPANPDLSEKPATVAALREYVRSLSGK